MQSVPVRFMEMTVLDAFRIFYDRFPSAVGRSTFYSLRPREVKIAAPHETCMCIIHENIDLFTQGRCCLTYSNDPIVLFKLGLEQLLAEAF